MYDLFPVILVEELLLILESIVFRTDDAQLKEDSSSLVPGCASLVEDPKGENRNKGLPFAQRTCAVYCNWRYVVTADHRARRQDVR